MSPKPGRVRRVLVTGAIVAGASLGAAGIASAATSSTTSASSGSSSTTAPSAGGPGPLSPGAAANPATMTHGPNETLLTGTDLQSATAAATAAVPGATVIRAETDSSGASPYEVHMKKADGTYVTVELDSSFKAITTVSGFGPGPQGSQSPSVPMSPPTSTNGTA
jgi:hypothetical protein